MIVIDQERIRALVSRPSESLNVEIKRWISPDDPLGVAKIVQASFAIRNRNGGFIVFGFDNRTLNPHAANRPSDVRTAFHLDKIQSIVSRYASEPFEIGVGFEQRDGSEHAVIVIPDGVKSPVAANRDLIHAGRTLIGIGDVYFRTLKANGTPSTAHARPEDWSEIVEICFENREADLGRFLRRHLAGQDVSALRSAFAQLGASTPPAPTLHERAVTLLRLGEQRFRAALANRTIGEEQRRVVEAGTWSVAVVIEPYRERAMPTQTFLTVRCPATLLIRGGLLGSTRVFLRTKVDDRQSQIMHGKRSSFLAGKAAGPIISISGGLIRKESSISCETCKMTRPTIYSHGQCWTRS